jgi:hypothetical protein
MTYRRGERNQLWRCTCMCGHVVIFGNHHLRQGYIKCIRCGTKLVAIMERAFDNDQYAN